MSTSTLNKENEIICNFNFVFKFSVEEEEEVVVDGEDEEEVVVVVGEVVDPCPPPLPPPLSPSSSLPRPAKEGNVPTSNWGGWRHI